MYDERARNAAFDEAIRDVVGGCIEEVECTLYESARSGKNIAATIFFLKTRKPEVYGDRLRAEAVETIKANARREVIAELRREVEALTPEARNLLMEAIPSA